MGALLVGLASVLAASSQPRPVSRAPSDTLVRLSADDFCLNLHHFLYVLGRAQAAQPDASRDAVRGAPAEQERGLATLASGDQTIWRDVVAFYAGGLSKRDAVFDKDLVHITGALARVGDAPALPRDAALPASVADELTRAAPAYRKAWWPAHQRANRRWTADTRVLVDRHGPAIVDFLTGIYQLEWPAAGYPVHVSAFTNWAGAYSTDGPLLMISSLAADMRGTSALEMVFHEASHQWDRPIMARLEEIGQSMGKRVPGALPHTLIWMTAGEAVRRLVPDHVPYAEAGGLWTFNPNARLREPLDTAWMPYLKGRGTRDEALTTLITLAGR